MALVKISGEDIPVSTSAIGPTASLLTSRVLMGIFWLKSGGKIHHNVGTTPTAAGVTGDLGENLDNKWEIWGLDNLRTFTMILRTGELAAVVPAQYWGERSG